MLCSPTHTTNSSEETSLVMWKKFGALNNPQTEFLKWGKAIVSLKAPPDALLDMLAGFKIVLPGILEEENPQEPEPFLKKAKTS